MSVYIYDLVPPSKKDVYVYIYIYIYIYICISVGVFNGALFAETLHFEHVDLTLR